MNERDEQRIREIVREELVAAMKVIEKRERVITDVEQLPLVMKPKDVQQVLRCGRTKAYDYIRRNDFPKIIEGGSITIPRDRFIEWLGAKR